MQRIINEDPAVLRESDRLGRTLLHYAAIGNHPEIAEYLISKGADVNARARVFHAKTPLHTAAAYGSLDVAKVLVRHGADVNAQEKGVLTSDCKKYDGRNVLSAATRKGNVKLVKFLLEKGAKIEYGEGKTRDTALHWAAFGINTCVPDGECHKLSNAATIDLLAERTGDINVRDGYERTPLHVAVHIGAVETVRHLLENYPEIDINAQDKARDTPLEYAKDPDAFDVTRKEQFAIIGLLLEHGAEANITSSEKGETADDLQGPILPNPNRATEKARERLEPVEANKP